MALGGAFCPSNLSAIRISQMPFLKLPFRLSISLSSALILSSSLIVSSNLDVWGVHFLSLLFSTIHLQGWSISCLHSAGHCRYFKAHNSVSQQSVFPLSTIAIISLITRDFWVEAIGTGYAFTDINRSKAQLLFTGTYFFNSVSSMPLLIFTGHLLNRNKKSCLVKNSLAMKTILK